VGALPAVWESRLLQLRAEARRMTGRLQEARADAARALACALRGDDPIERGLARAIVALVEHTVGELDEALAGYREAVRWLAEAGEEHYQAVWLGNLGRLLCERGAHAEAEPVLRRVLELRLRAPNALQVARARGDLGWLLMELGLSGEAEHQLRLSAEGTSDSTVQMLAQQALGRLMLDLGRPVEALDFLERSGQLAQELGEPFTRALSANCRAMGHLLLGDLAQAEREMRLSVELHQISEQPHRAEPARLWMAAVVASRGRIREAEALLASVPGEVFGLRTVARVAVELARARKARTEGAARVRGRKELEGLEEKAAVDVELRVAKRWMEGVLKGS
jgi:tetratricopeptide (TPR) repeat protein